MCIHICIDLCIDSLQCRYLSACLYAYVYTFLCTFLDACQNTCLYTCLYIFLDACRHACLYTYLYACRHVLCVHAVFAVVRARTHSHKHKRHTRTHTSTSAPAHARTRASMHACMFACLHGPGFCGDRRTCLTRQPHRSRCDWSLHRRMSMHTSKHMSKRMFFRMTSALSRHCRRRLHCAGMGVPVLKMTALEMTASPRRSF